MLFNRVENNTKILLLKTTGCFLWFCFLCDFYCCFFSRLGGLPFEMLKPRYNAETEAAMREADDIIAGRVQAKKYSSVAEMNADIDAESE